MISSPNRVHPPATPGSSLSTHTPQIYQHGMHAHLNIQMQFCKISGEKVFACMHTAGMGNQHSLAMGLNLDIIMWDCRWELELHASTDHSIFCIYHSIHGLYYGGMFLARAWFRYVLTS